LSSINLTDDGLELRREDGGREHGAANAAERQTAMNLWRMGGHEAKLGQGQRLVFEGNEMED
jgi:hypothetical protein